MFATMIKYDICLSYWASACVASFWLGRRSLRCFSLDGGFRHQKTDVAFTMAFKALWYGGAYHYGNGGA